MARRELGIWRRLDHSNIVPFLGIATGFGVFGSKSLVSSWMPNGTLQSFLQKYENLEVDHRFRLVGSLAPNSFYRLMHSDSYSTLPTDYTIVGVLCRRPLFSSAILITVHSFSFRTTTTTTNSNPIVHGDLNPVRNETEIIFGN